MTDKELHELMNKLHTMMRDDNLGMISLLIEEARASKDKLHIVAVLRCTHTFKDRLPDWNSLLEYAHELGYESSLKGLTRSA